MIRNACLTQFVFSLEKNLSLSTDQLEKRTIIADSVLPFLYTLKFSIPFPGQIKGFLQNPSRPK